MRPTSRAVGVGQGISSSSLGPSWHCMIRKGLAQPSASLFTEHSECTLTYDCWLPRPFRNAQLRTSFWMPRWVLCGTEAGRTAAGGCLKWGSSKRRGAVVTVIHTGFWRLGMKREPWGISAIFLNIDHTMKSWRLGCVVLMKIFKIMSPVLFTFFFFLTW